jgi:hypothetical protein
MAVTALGLAMTMVCGCEMFKKKDKDATTQPQKMSTSGSEKCTACDASKAK